MSWFIGQEQFGAGYRSTWGDGFCASHPRHGERLSVVPGTQRCQVGHGHLGPLLWSRIAASTLTETRAQHAGVDYARVECHGGEACRQFLSERGVEIPPDATRAVLEALKREAEGDPEGEATSASDREQIEAALEQARAKRESQREREELRQIIEAKLAGRV